jgi:hypothetical protein
MKELRVNARTVRVKARQTIFLDVLLSPALEAAHVENLLTPGEFPVEQATRKNFFAEIEPETTQPAGRMPPSYFVSLVSRFAVRRIVGSHIIISGKNDGPAASA